MHKHFLIFIPVLLLTTGMAMAQVIKGKITDEQTGAPLAGASIYLNGTYKGTSSNSEGYFEINSSEVNIPLIISHVGYESDAITGYSGKYLSIKLRHKANILKEVTIGFDAMSHEDEMKLFLKMFIGTENHECTIENPDDISFSYKKKTETLTAEADEPLIIRNKKLGYKLKYFLISFKCTPTDFSFRGNYLFAEDTTGLQQKDLKKILKARDEVYYGSRMHFIRSLWAGNLRAQRFHLNTDTLVATYDDQKFIKYKNVVIIDYKGRFSNMIQREKGRETLIAANGFYDPNIQWIGEMATQRVGEMLPFEFQPSQK
ncbi:MAG: carboxypeptidase-like regulatory domain-containing protein [Mucilaginibacter sp.]